MEPCVAHGCSHAMVDSKKAGVLHRTGPRVALKLVVVGVLTSLRYLLQRKTVRDLNVEAAQVTKRVKAEKRAERRMDEGAAVVELEDLTDEVCIIQ